MQNLFRLSLCRRIVILLGIAAQIHVPLSICGEKSGLQSGQLAAGLSEGRGKSFGGISNGATERNALFKKAKETTQGAHLARGEQVASLDCLKDEGVEVRRSWEVGL